ncbi:MAG: PAS domain-containing sensor histidine kinase [Actinomycetota bacterium]|nr:PAS domain-containing sensor histidine kinase [Actinomycetota bacterium]
MPTLTDLVEAHCDVSGDDVEWLQLLTADWQMLADLSFADLILWVPTRDHERFVAVAQMRPTTGPTSHYDDVVGNVIRRGRRPQIDRAYDEARICRERDPDWRDDIPVREETVPVVRDGRVIAVVARHTNLATARTPSRLELTYMTCADDLARMIAEGSFPYAGVGVGRRGAPRVGDGLVRLSREGTVLYASPNAVSAYRRLGLTGDLLGRDFGEVTSSLAPSSGPVDEALAVVVSGRAPRRTEVEAHGVVVALRAIPLRRSGARTGALVLARDVTDIRRRERELVTKDATIREIHHRVKNNLQTVAALLRLQARRIDEPRGRMALDEAVLRVGSIALVHEMLSQALDEHVPFDSIADRVAAMVAEVSGAQARVRREGSFGILPGHLATPMALVLNELVANAVEHGLHGNRGSVVVRAGRLTGRLRVVVEDDGAGLPEDFDPETSGSLGLHIVRTLVTSDMAGVLELRSRSSGGTEAVVDVPLAQMPTT